MTIQITRPEVEALINQRLESGTFKDAEEVNLEALQTPGPSPRVSSNSAVRRSSGSEHSERPMGFRSAG